MDAAMTLRSASLNCTLQWRMRPSAHRTRRTDELPNIDAGSHFVRENTRFRAIPTAQTSPNHSSSTAICNHCLANHTTTALTKAAIHNMDAAITPELYFTVEDASDRAPHPSHRRASQHRHRGPLFGRKQTVSCDS